MSKYLLASLLLLTAPALSQTPQLRMAIVLTRHGVRSPLAASNVSPYAKESWPSLSDWGVACPGDLTKRGEQLVEQMGGFYHAYYAEKGLLPAVNQCLASQVNIWSDNEERTMGTANALAAGMTKGVANCKIQVNSLPYTPPPHSGPNQCKASKDNDAFFHPLSDPVLNARVDPMQLSIAAAKINQEMPQLLNRYHDSLQMMQNTLQCCQPTECNGQKPCTLFNLNHAAKVLGQSLKWDGMFSVSSTAAENFLLEYGNGMPCNLHGSGWGRVAYKSPDCESGQSFRKMEELHTLYFDKTKHTGYLAQIQGSNLTNQILKRMLGQIGSPTFVIYSGHDTDVSSVAGLLGLNWSLPDLPDNDTPPAGALIFELWGGVTPDRQSVRMYYMHQTLEQLRTLAQLPPQKPDIRELKLPGCEEPCPFTDFQNIVNGAILKNFTTTGPSRALAKRRRANTSLRRSYTHFVGSIKHPSDAQRA
jgi:4-phytase/acid phosphatase